MPKTILNIACSMDGYIAKPDGDIDWLNEYLTSGENYGFHAFLDTIDSVVMGARTWDFILKYGQWPYGDNRGFVFAHGNPEPIEGAPVKFLSGAPDQLHKHIASEAKRTSGWLAAPK